MNLSVVVWFLFLGVMLILELIIGIYVYRDARKRGMNAILWTLVAVLVPSAIGLLIYLLARGGSNGLRCPGCGMEVARDWRVCPKCALPLPGLNPENTGNIEKKDRSIWKVLAMVILVPVLLIGVLIAFSFAPFSGSGSATISEFSLDEYTQAQTPDAQAALAWMEDLPKDKNQAYALRFDRHTESTTEYFFLVYTPGTSYGPQGFRQGSSIFGTTLELELHRTGQNGRVINILSSSKNAPKLKVRANSQEIPCEVTVVDYNPTMFYLEPQESAWEIEAISVSKIVGSQRMEHRAIEQEDLGFDLMMCLSHAPYHTTDRSIDLSIGYEITIHDKNRREVRQFQALPMDGGYWLMETGRNTDGTYLWQLEEETYEKLQALFPQ